MSPSTWVPLLVLGIIGVQVAIWIPVLFLLRKRQVAQLASLNELLSAAAAAGEPTVCPPLVARVRRGSLSVSTAIAATSRRLFILGAARGEVPLSEVKAVRTDAWFNGNARGGFRWVIVTLGDGELGLSVPTAAQDAWAKALER
jgi:hypothetical protein